MNLTQNLLKGKKIVVCVTGSIAIYKAIELVRLFVKADAEVRVIMSQSAKKFISALTFETISQNRVLDDTNESWADDYNHIKIAEWADIFVIAPATANTIAKFANAIADNILLQSVLAFSGKKILAPAANTNMLHNPISQANLKMLAIANYEIVDTQTKELACQRVGDGAMADVEDIFYLTARELLKDPFWDNRMVIVTGGGTVEKIDDVRYISNYSSGKMGSAMATALYLKGADVNLIATRFGENLSSMIHTIEVESSDEMYRYLVDSIRVAKKGKLSKATLIGDDEIKLIQKTPYLFMSAAVSDYVPEFVQSKKLKKDVLGEKWALSLKQNRDILQSLDKDGIVTVGFKAEMDESCAFENAKNMLEKKELDAVCLNVLKDSSSFGTSTNSIEFINKHNSVKLPEDDKLKLSLEILELAKELSDE